MPTFYEGKPLALFDFKMEESEYAQAYYLKQNFRSKFHRQEIKVGICVTLVVLFAATIPFFNGKFGSFWIPASAVLISILFGIYFILLQPKSIQKLGAEIYRSNQLLSLENTVSIYRDSFIYKNSYETITQYWTDFDQCIESETMLLFIGGERTLVVLKTSVLSAENRDRLSEHFQSVFASKYQKAKR